MTLHPVHVHFETRANKPAVFHMTEPAILAAQMRAAADVRFSVNDDPRDLSWLQQATGLVTSNDVLLEPDFPIVDLARRVPRLRWIHIIGAGIEPLPPLDWMPTGMVMTNNSGVHVAKPRESALMALLMLHGKLPTMMTQQRQHLWRPIFTSRIAGSSSTRRSRATAACSASRRRMPCAAAPISGCLPDIMEAGSTAC
jgi:phosphoglycerate dehydrogenase-like enzyme